MGVIGTVAAVIGSAIASAAVAVASVVMSVVSAVAAAVSAIASAVYAGVSAAVSAVASGISTVASSIAGGISSAVGTVGSTLSSWAGTVYSYAQSVYGAMQTFAEVIHLKTIMMVHDIAYLVSTDYREMINKVYRQFSRVSEELGLGAQFINLALENARSIVLNVSSMMGKSYDLSQVTWLKSLSSFTKKFQKQTDKYEDNPGAVFQDIDEWLLKDSVNVGSDVQRTLFNTLKNTTEIVEDTVNKIIIVRDDLEQFVDDLPKEIREEVGPWVDSVTEKVDGFLEDEYKPYKQRMDDIIDVIDNKQTTTKNRVDDIVGRLTKPGDVLLGVDRLPVDERIDQEDKISDVAARQNQRQAQELQEQAIPDWEHLRKVRRAIQQPLPPPEYIIPERRKLIVPAGEQSREADTWFVGDY